jgi:hypothetical protein
MPFSQQEHLNSATEAVECHRNLGACIAEAMRRHSEQASQLTGLYEEVDKLTKGRSIVPTPDLLVELSNNLISDIKTLIFRDTYLDRQSLFVPAGDNPSYPEILITLRVLQQSLKRFETMLKSESAKHSSVVLELRTILAALEIAQTEEERVENEGDEDTGNEEADDEDESEIQDDIESEEEEGNDPEDADPDSQQYQIYVSKNAVRRRLDLEPKFENLLGGEDRKPYDRWFERLDGEYYFNFAMLFASELPKYEPPSAGITFVEPGK